MALGCCLEPLAAAYFLLHLPWVWVGAGKAGGGCMQGA